jgi:hypothetical protein
VVLFGLSELSTLLKAEKWIFSRANTNLFFLIQIMMEPLNSKHLVTKIN